MAQNPLGDVFNACGAVITYAPLRTEVSFGDYVSIPEGVPVYEIAPRAALDPMKEAAAAIAAAAGARAAVLMPGRKFDASGTRFGQGGGWYDRFLALVPANWVRIGFCHTTQFSADPLQREPWDQVMDFVCTINKETKTLTVYETRGRKVLE